MCLMTSNVALKRSRGAITSHDGGVAICTTRTITITRLVTRTGCETSEGLTALMTQVSVCWALRLAGGYVSPVRGKYCCQLQNRRWNDGINMCLA